MPFSLVLKERNRAELLKMIFVGGVFLLLANGHIASVLMPADKFTDALERASCDAKRDSQMRVERYSKR